jgi:hypothetical protein
MNKSDVMPMVDLVEEEVVEVEGFGNWKENWEDW